MKKLLIFFLTCSLYAMDSGKEVALCKTDYSPPLSLLELSALTLHKTIDWKASQDNQQEQANAIVTHIPLDLAEKSIEILKKYSAIQTKLPYQGPVLYDDNELYAVTVQSEKSYNPGSFEALGTCTFTIKTLQKPSEKKLSIITLEKVLLHSNKIISPDGSHLFVLIKNADDKTALLCLNHRTDRQMLIPYEKLLDIERIPNSDYLIFHRTDSTEQFATMQEIIEYCNEEERNNYKTIFKPIRSMPATVALKSASLNPFFMSYYDTWLKEYPRELFEKFLALEEKLTKNNEKILSIHPNGRILAATNKHNANQIELWCIEYEQIAGKAPLAKQEKPLLVTQLQWICDGDKLIVHTCDGNHIKLDLINFDVALLINRSVKNYSTFFK